MKDDADTTVTRTTVYTAAATSTKSSNTQTRTIDWKRTVVSSSAIGTNTNVSSFPARWALQMISLIGLCLCSHRLRCIETRTTTVRPAAALARETLVVRINDRVDDRRRCL